MTHAPLPPGLERAIAAFQAGRERLPARRRHPAPAPARNAAGEARTLAVGPKPPPPWPQPSPERVNRPVSVGQALRAWWTRY